MRATDVFHRGQISVSRGFGSDAVSFSPADSLVIYTPMVESNSMTRYSVENKNIMKKKKNRHVHDLRKFNVDSSFRNAYKRSIDSTGESRSWNCGTRLLLCIRKQGTDKIR